MLDPQTAVWNNTPRFPKLRLPLLWRHVVGFSDVHFRLCPNIPWFRTCIDFLACTYDSLRLFPSICEYFVILILCLSNDVGLLDGGALKGLLSRSATANHSCESSNAPLVLPALFVFSADNSCRTTPHVQKDFHNALCLLQTLH